MTSKKSLTICLVGTFILTFKWLSESDCSICNHSPKWIIIWFYLHNVNLFNIKGIW